MFFALFKSQRLDREAPTQSVKIFSLKAYIKYKVYVFFSPLDDK